MVEMVETAAILNQAGPRALVILDEIGRGTATFDGLSIAWAAVEHLHEVNRCRALFATHYHELTALAAKLAAPRLPHDAGQGMAGRRRLPARGRRPAPPTAPTASMSPSSPACRKRVIGARRGGAGGARKGRAGRRADAPRRRSAAVQRAARRRASATRDPLAEALRETHPDELTPREALELVYKLKGLVKPTDG